MPGMIVVRSEDGWKTWTPCMGGGVIHDAHGDFVHTSVSHLSIPFCILDRHSLVWWFCAFLTWHRRWDGSNSELQLPSYWGRLGCKYNQAGKWTDIHWRYYRRRRRIRRDYTVDVLGKPRSTHSSQCIQVGNCHIHQLELYLLSCSFSTTVPEALIRADPLTADLYDDNQVANIVVVWKGIGLTRSPVFSLAWMHPGLEMDALSLVGHV